MWLNARTTHCSLQQAITHLPDPEPLDELVRSKAIDEVLPSLKRVLQNNPRNPADRQKLAGAEIAIGGEAVRLDDSIRAESLVLSEEFDLNELDAVDLILTGEAQNEIFDNVGRGLCAVLCYYDTHRYQTGMLSMLLSLHDNAEIPRSLATTIESLLKDRSLFDRLINVMCTFTTKKELERLSKPTVNGVGNPKHKRMLIDLMADVRRNCFSALYNICTSISNDLAPQYLSALFQKVREIAVTAEFDDASLALWTVTQSFIVPTRLAQFADPRLVLEVVHEQFHSQQWKDTAIAATIHLNYTVALKSIASRTSLANSEMFASDMAEKTLDAAIDMKALQFIRDFVLTVPDFKEHYAFPHIVDCILKALCTYYPEKLHELLRICEAEIEYVEEHGLGNLTQLPALHYRALIDIMTYLYSLDIPDIVAASDQYFSNDYPGLHHLMACGRQVSNPIMLVAFLNMLRSMCRTENAALTMYYFFKKRGRGDTLSWDHLFAAVRNYLNMFAEAGGSKVIMGQAELTGLIVWIRLAETLSLQSAECRQNFLKERGLVVSLIGLVASPVHTYLKGAILRLLASFALDAEHTSQIWHGLFRSGIITVDGEGNLEGLPKDLELRERPTGRYDCCTGFLKLMENLFCHCSIPATSDSAPYIAFLVKSVIGGTFSRTYQDHNDMWNMLCCSFNILYNICNNRNVDVNTVKEGQVNIVVLTQLLNSSVLLDAIKRTLFEGSRYIATFGSPEKEREAATSAALRLLQKAVLSHTQLRDALRFADSTIKIAQLDEIFLSISDIRFPDGHIESMNLYALLSPYVSTLPELLPHTNYVLDIMHKLSVLDPSKSNQAKYRQALASGAEQLAYVCAQLASIENADVEWKLGQSKVAIDISDMTHPELHGLAFCNILEIICHGLESCPKEYSIASLLLGCDDTTKLEDTFGSSCMRGILSVIEKAINSDEPWSGPHAGLLEGSLRALDCLVNPGTKFSYDSLSYLRANGDVIYSIMCFIFNMMAVGADVPAGADVPLIQGTILNLIAVELSSLAMQGIFEQAERYYHYLLIPASSQAAAEDGDEMIPINEGSSPPIWYAFHEIVLAEEKSHSEQWAILHLLSGQMALINVVALFADIGFFDQRVLLYCLCDGVINYIIEFAGQLDLSETVTDMITDCLFRVVQAISKLSIRFGAEITENPVHSDCVSVLDALVKFFVNPGNFMSVRGKIDMYGAVFQLLHTIRKLQSEVVNPETYEADPNLTLIEVQTRLRKGAPVEKLIELSGTYLARTFNSDISSSVFSLKMIAVSCITELLHEDVEATRNFIELLVRNGSIRFLLESLCTSNAVKSAKLEGNEKETMYIKTVLAFFARVAVTPAGKQALVELSALPRLAKFPFWKEEAPKFPFWRQFKDCEL